MLKLHRKNVYLVGGGMVLVLILLSLGYYLSWRNWAVFQSAVGDEFVGRVGAIGSETESVTYNLVEGWNFIAFPVNPITVRTAAELIKDVGDAGGYVTMVSRWNGDRWQELAQLGPEQYGNDFPLVPGEAYFIQNQKAVEWKIVGSALARDADYGKVVLHPGWNAIGLNPVTVIDARGVLDRLNQDGGVELASEIDAWYSGNWQMFVKRWYSSDDIQEYGDNFRLDGTRGYMIQAFEEVPLTTTE